MRRWIGWAARCYPAAWRERYGAEFAALLEDAEPRANDVWDVLRGALSMQLKTPAPYLRFGVVTAVLGAIAACAVSLAMPKRYVSTAVLRPTQPMNSGAANEFLQKQQSVLSRGSLTELIQRPALDLYREDRQLYPVEDVLQTMRDRDLHIEAAPAGVRVTFEYGDAIKAQAVVREVSARLGDDVLEVVTPASLPEHPVRPDWLRLIAAGLAGGLAVGILLAFLRGRTVRWVLKMAGCGLAGGMAAVAICLLLPQTFTDERRAYELVSLGGACGLTVGAFLMRQRRSGGGYAVQVAFCAICCALLGAFASFMVAERYVSIATLRVVPSPGAAASPAERVRVLTEDVLSRGNLVELVQRPSLDLYRKERQRYPLEDIIEEMRTRDLKIEPVSGLGLAVVDPTAVFRISFGYPDRLKAHAVARQLVTKYTERNFLMNREAQAERTPGELMMEIIDPASVPVESVSPNRLIYTGVGLAFGAMLGVLLGWRRRKAEARPSNEGRQVRYLKYAVLAGLAGIAIAALASFAIPERYVSTAVLRVAVPEGQDATVRAQEMIAQVMTKDALTEIMQSPGLDLYHGERQRRPMEEVLQHMRRDLQAGALTGPMGKDGGPARMAAFRIAFEYSDREKAQGCVHAVINRLVESQRPVSPQRDAAHLFDSNLLESAVPQKLEAPAATATAIPSGNHAEFLGRGTLAPATHGTDLFASTSLTGGGGEPRTDEVKLEVLDAASRPQSPVSPNRMTISMAGGVTGLAAGLLLARRRRA